MKYFYKRIAKQLKVIGCLSAFLFFSNLSAQDWDPITPPGAPSARQGQSMKTLPDGRVLLFGGEDVEGTLLNDTYAFDINGWKQLIPTNTPPPARRDHQAWTRADLMYIYGGEGENGPLNDLWSYNSTTNTWQQEQLSGPGPVARHGHAITTLTDGSEIIVGGTDADGNPLKDCWRLNSDNTFTQLQDAPATYTGHSMELGPNGEWLYVFGRPGSIGIYRVSTDRWSFVSGGPPNGEGCMTSKGTNGGEPVIFIFGGKDVNGNEMNQTYQYNLYSGELTQRGNMPQPIVNGSTAKISALPPGSALKNGGISSMQSFNETQLVFGGLTNGVPTNNEYTFSTQAAPDTITTIATADTIRADKVDLFWNIASPIGATYYEVQVLLDSTANTIFADTVLTDTTVTITGLTPQTEYWWRVRGYNAGGWGVSSIILNFYTDFVTGVEDNGITIPGKFELFQNYPNPFNPTTTIKYALKNASHVRLEVFNILGQRVMLPVNKVMQAGAYEAVLDFSHFASGVYFYTLRSGNFIQTKKMILLK